MSAAVNDKEDPPPYLTVGTEVSAKFKGAFCEAKITKVEKSVKCKLTYKNSSNESVTLNESQLKQQNGQPLGLNDFKIGSIVYVSKNNDNSNLQPAVLNKVLDQSVYTVIFNDGDEKTMKRSFIRFKGEKHYLESETLNNAPLNNPEHFLFPIKQKDGEVNVNPETVPKSTNNDHDMSNDESNEDNCSVSSDECSPEERDRFVAQLYKFMDDRGTPMNKIPSINKTDLDLYKLFNAVKKMGGFNKVTKQRSWSDVYKKLNLPNPSNSQNILNLKSAYERYLQPYEEISRKLGGNMIDYSAGSSTSKRTSTLNSADTQSRTNQLFKRQVITPSNTSVTSNQKKKQAKQKNNNSNSTIVAASSPATTTSTIEISEQNLDILGSKEPTIESLSLNNDDPQQNQPQNEELTLFSMVQNLNENYKKAKKEKLEKKENNDDEKVEVAAVINEPQQQAVVKKSKGRQPNKITAKSNSQDNKTLVIKPESVSDNNEDMDEESEESTKPGKKKSSRLSLSVNDESSLTVTATSTGRGGLKRKSSISNNNNKDDKNFDSENDNKDSSSQEGNQMELGSNDAANNTDTDLNENDYKTNLTITDLEVNKLVDVKYGGNQKQQMYRAKIVQINTDNNTILVHYLGWNNRYDEWVKIDRIIRMLNDENITNSKRRKTSKLHHRENGNNQPPTNDNSSKQNTETSSLSSSSSSSSTSKPSKNMKKRDSTSSVTSSASDQPSQIKEENTANVVTKKADSIKTTVEIAENSSKSNQKIKLKTRSSNSASSSSSSNIIPPISSKSVDDKAEMTTIISDQITTASLLSIKKEIVDFEPSIQTTSQSPVLIESTEIVAEITTKTSSNIIEAETQLDKNKTHPVVEASSVEQPIIKTEEQATTTTIKKSNRSVKNSNKTDKPVRSSTRKESQMDLPEPSPAAPTPPPAVAVASPPCPKDEIYQENKTENVKPAPVKSTLSDTSINVKQKPDEIENQSESEIINNNNQQSPTKPINDSVSSKNAISTSKNENLTNLTNTTSNECTNSKYSFHITNTSLCGKQRIRHIEEQMRLCRDAYAKLKNEVAAIDRKKKKLKRDLLDKSSSNNNGNNNNNNNDENLNNSKQDNQTCSASVNNNSANSTSNNNINSKKFNDLKV